MGTGVLDQFEVGYLIGQSRHFGLDCTLSTRHAQFRPIRGRDRSEATQTSLILLNFQVYFRPPHACEAGAAPEPEGNSADCDQFLDSTHTS